MPPWPQHSVKADLYSKIVCILEKKQTNLGGKKVALSCGVFLHVGIINNEMVPVSRGGFIWFCALTLVHFCRLERVLLFLLLVPIPQRHETPLHLLCEIKRSWSQSLILGGPECPCCVTQSLFLLFIHRSMLWTSTSSHPVRAKCAPM